MKVFLLVVVVILASTLVGSKEVKKVKKTQHPNTSSLLEWKIRDALKKNNMIHPKIIGGNVADYDQFPYQVRLTMYGLALSIFIIAGWCGGSIIADTWVLTAAHCLHRDPDPLPFEVVAADVDSNQFRQTSFVLIFDFIIHEDYDSSTRYKDFALINTDKWKFDAYVKPINLPDYSTNINLYVGRTAVASGYGPTTNTEIGTPSKTLRYITLQGISREQCVRQYDNNPENVPDSAFCAQDPEVIKGSICSYDTGGPLALMDTNGPTLIGVASFTHPERGCDGTAQGFQNVALEVEWIKTEAGIN